MNRRNFFTTLFGATILSTAAKSIPVKRNWSHLLLAIPVPEGHFMYRMGVVKPMTQAEAKAFLRGRYEFWKSNKPVFSQ